MKYSWNIYRNILKLSEWKEIENLVLRLFFTKNALGPHYLNENSCLSGRTFVILTQELFINWCHNSNYILFMEKCYYQINIQKWVCLLGFPFSNVIKDSITNIISFAWQKKKERCHVIGGKKSNGNYVLYHHILILPLLEEETLIPDMIQHYLLSLSVL